jgi:hypothetical protein
MDFEVEVDKILSCLPRDGRRNRFYEYWIWQNMFGQIFIKFCCNLSVIDKII